ncbi:MAG: hypothetical protein KDD69_06500 [Bdellovibrionales bacterium]|nr:hypothetical protein [Bdellovibrionales bacterium]
MSDSNATTEGCCVRAGTCSSKLQCTPCLIVPMLAAIAVILKLAGVF